MCKIIKQIVSVALLEIASALRLSREPRLQEVAQPVFYMIAMGELARKHQTRLWLHSLRANGGWTGDVVMVTDEPDCLVKNIRMNQDGWDKLSDNGTVAVYHMPSDATGRVYILKKKPTTQRVEMKKQKALAWINVRQIGLHPSMIIYTDQDIVFGGSVGPIIKYVNSLEPGHTLALFNDMGHSRGEWHTGILFLFLNDATERCLADWGQKLVPAGGFANFDSISEKQDETRALPKELDEAQLGIDQQTLGKTDSCKAGSGVAILPGSFLMFPESENLNKTTTFVHFTNTLRWQKLSSKDKNHYFKSVLGLDDVDYDDFEKC